MATVERVPAYFLQAYLEAALWASTDCDGNPLDDNYDIEDIAPEALDFVIEELEAFRNRDDVAPLLEAMTVSEEEHAARDLFLTRNGHGAGFWDGDWPDAIGKVLDAAARQCGSGEPIVGDDGLIYFT